MQKKNTKLKEITKTLKDEFKPSRMFLFGSRSNGKEKANSDYDFVLVIPRNKKSRIDTLVTASELIWKKHKVSADVFIYSEKEFDEWKDELSSIPETALNTGQEIDLG